MRWINATLYYGEHFAKIQLVVQTFNEDDAVSIRIVIKYLENNIFHVI